MTKVRFNRETISVICDCQDINHLSEIIYSSSSHPSDDPELYWEVQLNHQYGFWKRCLAALGYIAGKRSIFGYGHWDCGSFSYESAKELIPLFQRYVREYEEHIRKFSSAVQEEYLGVQE